MTRSILLAFICLTNLSFATQQASNFYEYCGDTRFSPCRVFNDTDIEQIITLTFRPRSIGTQPPYSSYSYLIRPESWTDLQVVFPLYRDQTGLLIGYTFDKIRSIRSEESLGLANMPWGSQFQITDDGIFLLTQAKD